MNSQKIAIGSLLKRSLNPLEAKYAPPELFYRGHVSLATKPKVAIVGSRAATPEGLSLASQLATALASENIVVVSGLALGIDTAAHRSAVEAGGSTIAVIGTPLSQSYPKENALLQEEIAQKHLLLSQFASGQSTSKGNFPLRNRTMALIADATVIVEAGEKSGTEHQGWEALRLNRPLFIMEPLASNTNFEWIKKLLAYGAESLTVDDLSLLLEQVPSPMTYPTEELSVAV